MKKFYLSLVVAFMSMTTIASAQFVQNDTTVQQTSNNNIGNIFRSMTTDDYNRIYVGYNPTKITWNHYQSDFDYFLPLKHGITVGYLHGSNIVKNLPLYIEWGANFQYLFGKETYTEGYSDWEYEETAKLNVFSINVPINLSFRFSFKNNALSITPYLGLNFRLNAAGTRKYECKEWYDGEFDESYEETYKLFSTKDMDDGGMGDYAFKRFQVGFNVGVGLSYKALYIGVGHVVDFSKIAKYEDFEDENVTGKLGITTITLGINF